MNPVFLSVRELTKSFKDRQALRGVSFQLNCGETLGLVGESGSGKSTLARCLMRLIDPDSGTIEFQGLDITHLQGSSLLPVRRQIQMVFQDPYASLNPRLTIGTMLEEPLQVHGIRENSKQRQERVDELLKMVGLDPAMKSRHPRDFSGGQRQRICIARALAVEPSLLICDEAVSSLDVSVQAQILQLLKDLQSRLGLTYLFISHDLRVIEQISNRVAVMSEGMIVELDEKKNLFQQPQHPHTKALLASRLSIPY